MKILLSHLHPILQRQKLNYRIFVVEQNGDDTFNKGRLFNAGFMVMNALQKFSCVIFHDVDLLTETDETIYDCLNIQKGPKIAGGMIPKNVLHFASKVDTLGYRVFENYFKDFTGKYLEILNFEPNLFRRRAFF